jgi:hypothetical protein
MNQSNLSQSPIGAEHSAFQSAQSALTRKPLPGPTWAWPVLAAVAVAGLAYLVTRAPAEHVAQRPAEPAVIASAEPAAPSPALAAATPPAEPTPPAASSAPAPAPSAAPPADAPAAKASDDSAGAVASAAPATKKGKRAATHRASRKHSARTN